MGADSVRDAADCLNYETRALRDPLHKSNERVKCAKGKAFSDLAPRQQNLQDWDPPEQSGDDHNAVARLKLIRPEVLEMQQAMLNFESDLSFCGAPSRDRAFFSALRALLAEIQSERNPLEQDTKLRAVCKWFMKYKPRGSHVDSATSAVLATSLSISAQPHPGAVNRPALQQRIISGEAAPFSVKGTKHEFSALFSRGPEGKDVQPKGTLALLREAMGGKHKQQHPLSTMQQKHRADMPMVWQPSSAISGASPHQPSLQGSTQVPHQKMGGIAKARAAYAPGCDSSDDECKGPIAANLVPRDRVRSQGAMQTTANSQQLGKADGKACSWFQGPYKPCPAAVPITAQMPRPRYKVQGNEDPSTNNLSSKWALMAEASSRSKAHVEGQLQAWSEERARFEGEMLRRQEANRHGSPQKQHLVDGAVGLAGNTAGAGTGSTGYLSAYQGVTVEAVSAMTTGLDKLTTEHPSALHQLALPHSIVAKARDVRMASQEEYTRDMQRLQELGMADYNEESIRRALAPVADKPYLDLLAALPKPGQHLPSRPGSVSARSKKKKPDSGRRSKKG